jgi:predicted ArsR family transcriptional regulator
MTQDARLAAMGALGDPVRRALFELVSRGPGTIDRDQAAAAMNLPRTTAAFHLDRLVAAGLLTVEFAKRSGRTGPGSGRPAKLYRLAMSEVSVAVPERHYDVMGDVLAAAIHVADESGEPVREALTAVARRRGRELGESAGTLAGMLESTGYVPEDAADGTVTLTNCPFHRLAMSHTDIICQANVALLEGAAEGAGDREHGIHFDPGEGRCCVILTGGERPT